MRCKEETEMNAKEQLLNHDNNDTDQSMQLTFTADGDAIVEMARKEYEALKDLVRILAREKEAILSFSLQDIRKVNDDKEDVARRLASLRTERNALMECVGKNEALRNDSYLFLIKAIKQVSREVRTSLKRNAKLLSLSANRVKSDIECVVDAINRSLPTYGKRAPLKPILFSGRV